MVTTAASVAATSRDTMVWSRRTTDAAMTTGSMLACGIDPCAPRPNRRICRLSAAEVIGQRMKKYLKDWSEWSPEDKKLLVPAQAERAMLELGKMGQKASGQTGVLLDAAMTDDRIIRQSVLLALPKIAPTPCTECETKLNAAIKAGEGKTTMTELNVETIILRNYFSWAGGGSGKPAEAPTPP